MTELKELPFAKSKSSKRKNKYKGLSDATLLSYWRKAVLFIHKNRCVICKKIRPDSELECHHIAKRKIKVLRFDWKNGVPVCNPKIDKCHAYSDTMAGRDEVRKEIGEDRYNHIKEYENVHIKDYLRENNLSENEWKTIVKDELVSIITKIK